MITFMEAVQAAYPNGIYGWDGVNKGTLTISNVSDIDFDWIEQKRAELQAAEPLRQLREQRNQKLSQSDWMALSDRTMSPEQIAYRQSLRDMPANNPDVALNEAGELINVTWPTEPTT